MQIWDVIMVAIFSFAFVFFVLLALYAIISLFLLILKKIQTYKTERANKEEEDLCL